MTYLIDTHVWLWLLAEPERIRAELLAELRSRRTRVLLSAVSSWEVAVKWAIGRLPLPAAPDVYVPVSMARSGVDGLPITHAHALRMASLPRHHRDPFDRLLIAQAQLESVPIITVDAVFDAYEVDVVNAA